LNNAAIAAQALRDAGAERVAILDVDYHHGNGTQSIFYDRADVLFVSLHAHPAQEYPFFLGYEDETGEGAGEGFNLNYPMRWQTAWDAYRDAFDSALGKIKGFGPDLVVVSLGVDTFESDPISSFRLKSADYLEMGRRIATLRRSTLFVFEGGYAVDELGVNVVNVLTGFEEA
jgi:acetoin utilization deacetylase AcuC-like enzyme